MCVPLTCANAEQPCHGGLGCLPIILSTFFPIKNYCYSEYQKSSPCTIAEISTSEDGLRVLSFPNSQVENLEPRLQTELTRLRLVLGPKSQGPPPLRHSRCGRPICLCGLTIVAKIPPSIIKAVQDENNEGETRGKRLRKHVRETDAKARYLNAARTRRNSDLTRG